MPGLTAAGGSGNESLARTQANLTRTADIAEIKGADATLGAADRMAHAGHDLTKTPVVVAQGGVDAADIVAVSGTETAHKVSIARCEG